MGLCFSETDSKGLSGVPQIARNDSSWVLLGQLETVSCPPDGAMDKEGLKEQKRYSLCWCHQRKKDVRGPGQEQRLAFEPSLSLFWPGPS